MTKWGIPVEDRFWAKVDKTEGCWNWTAYKQPTGYGTFAISQGVKKYAHRLAWEYLIGPIGEGMDLDHVCHNPGCVNPDHLREASRKENMEHRITAHSNSKTGIRGVFWNKARGKYRACVAHNKKVIHVGYFMDINDAAAAVAAKRNELFTHNDMDR